MRILLTIVLLICAATCSATDWGYTVTLGVAADSSDTATALRDTAISSALQIDPDTRMIVTGWEVFDADTNLTNDTILLQILTGMRRNGTFIPVDNLADAIAIGADDTLRYDVQVGSPDSLWNFYKIRAIHSVTLDSAGGADLSGNSYNWSGRYWFFQKR